jgi:hypothetical protein
MLYTLVKLDLVGSKEFIQNSGEKNEARARLLLELLKRIAKHYKNGDRLFP